MKAAIVVTASTAESQARELIAAAKAAGAKEIQLWVFMEDMRPFSSLPASEMLAVKADGALIAERYLPVLVFLYNHTKPELVLLSGGFFGDELAVRLGCIVDGSTASRIIQISSEDGRLKIARRVYGAHLEGEFIFEKSPFVFSVAKGSFHPDDGVGAPLLTWCDICLADAEWCTDWVETASERVQGLDTLDFVLVGGRGIGSKRNMEMLMQLGEMLGAGVGGTRPAVLNGWLPMDSMIGYSGTSIKAKMCITFGSSGSTPFLHGIERSELLVAINADAESPIFDHCDVGIIGDCITAIEELKKCAKK